MIGSLRTSIMALALTAGAVTVLLAVTPGLDVPYRNPSAHVALETIAALVALVAAILVWGRVRRRGSLEGLLLAIGLLVLALSNLVFAALPAVFGTHPRDLFVWGAMLGRGAGGALLAVAAFVPRGRVVDARAALWIAGAVAVGVVALTAGLVAALEDVLPGDIGTAGDAGGGRPDLVDHPLAATVQALGAAVYGVAALGFVRRFEHSGDELHAWLALASVLACFSRVNFALYPTLFSDWVYLGDVLRLLFHVTLLAGAAREVATYWEDSVVAARLEERRRLARELHDGLAQELAFIGRNTALLRAGAARDDAAQRIEDAVKRARGESRRVIEALKESTHAPLDELLARTAREVAERGGVGLELDLAAGVSVDPDTRHAIVRIVNEALTNAVRHSGTERVRVTLHRRGRHAVVDVTDHGSGFDPAATSGGFGLVSMRERAREIGAALDVRSVLGEGTRVELVL